MSAQLNHLKQKNKVEINIEYILRKNYNGPINNSILKNPYSWVCILTINNINQYIYSDTVKRNALNKLLLNYDKEIREFI